MRRKVAGGVLMGAFVALAASITVPDSASAQVTLEARGGSSIPAGAIDDMVDGGAVLGLGIGYRAGTRFSLRADGDWEMLNDQAVEDVVMPLTYLWHLQGGAELDLTNPETSQWMVRLRGGAGATVYDTDRLAPGGDDFVNTYFSAGGGLSIGRAVTPSMDVGLFGRFNVVFTDKDEIRELTEMSPTLLHPFSKGSTIPVGVYIRWR